MLIKILISGGYFFLVLGLGFWSSGFFAKKKEDPASYFLEGRDLHPAVLIGTLCATNFSAFTIFGASGAGYREGLAPFPVLGFGTGFMALSFWLLGPKIWELGRKHNLITPAELVGVLYNNRLLSAVFALVMIVFTVPYLALQPLAAGRVIGQLFAIPHSIGAVFTTCVIILYTMRGGLRAVALTDIVQGLFMLLLMIVAFFVVIEHHGGFTSAFSRLLEYNPDLLRRPGLRGVYSPQIWFSFITLWFFCDPMFPQLFQRFFAARSPGHLKITSLYYPAICTLIFFLPIATGALGRLSYPALDAQEADAVMVLLMTDIAGPVFGTLVLSAGLAALMSTMDSQLLTLSSIFMRDLSPLPGGKKWSARAGRFFIPVLALSGLGMALFSNTTILNLGLTAFTGLSVLFPTVFFGLYCKNPRGESALCSIAAGELLVILYHLRLVPDGGFLAAIPVIAVSLTVYLLVQMLREKLVFLSLKLSVPVVLLLLIFVASMDFWNWGTVGQLWYGLPLWVWYFVGLSAVQTGVCLYLFRKKASYRH